MNTTFKFYFLWTTVFWLEDSSSSCRSSAWNYDWFRSIFGLVGRCNEFLPYGLPGGTGDAPWTFVMSTRYKYINNQKYWSCFITQIIHLVAVRKPKLIIISVLLNLPIDSKLVYWRICIIFMPTSKLWGNHKPFSWHSINIKMLICEQRDAGQNCTLPDVDIASSCTKILFLYV